jgi:dephospho-CoA kinase
MFIVGLTGNYGMGKSAVLRMFGELGAVTLDADRIVHRLLRGKKILEKIKTIFGSSVFDKKGNLDKKKVAEKIFKNKDLRLKLEDLLHPLVFDRMDNFFKKKKNMSKVFIIEAPLIFERGYENRFDRTITVFTKETIAINRLSMLGLNLKQIRERLRCQMPIKEKIKRADFKIDNSGALEKTKKQVGVIYKELLKEAKIKNLLFKGNVHEAKKLLGKPYFIEGKIIKGARRGGKLLHTPTANILVSRCSPLKEGVYAVKVSIHRFTSALGGSPIHPFTHSPIHLFTDSPVYNGVANIGRNPTFGDMPLSYEVHIFNFSGNLLGKKLRVYFIKRIRGEKKFSDTKALEIQIKKDIKKAKEILEQTSHFHNYSEKSWLDG